MLTLLSHHPSHPPAYWSPLPALQQKPTPPNHFIQVQYPSEPVSDFASRVIHIGPFRRNVLTTRHPAHVADYKEFGGLLEHGSSEIWRLVDLGADGKAKDNNIGTALHSAALRGYAAMVRLLVDLGADIEAKDKYNMTALHWAALGGE